MSVKSFSNSRLTVFGSIIAFGFFLQGCSSYQTVTVERVDYHEPESKPSDVLEDDVFKADAVPAFDPEQVDPRPAHGWSVNLSASVTRLDLEMLKPDLDTDLLKVHSNYAQALKSIGAGITVIPSVNLIDGKAKQFDDGLYASLEEYWFRQREGEFHGDLDFLQRLASKVPADSEAAAWLATGLELAGINVDATNNASRAKWKTRFESEEIHTKPLGFYAWTPKLQQCYRVARFFQMESRLNDIAWLRPVLDGLRNDSELQDDYRKMLNRWARLSNAPWQLTVSDLLDHPDPADLQRFQQQRTPMPSAVALLPAGTNRESELCRKLFTEGFSASDDLMRELVSAIRKGDVDLHPRETSGWYDYQVYALETLLVPSRGQESSHLLLTAHYKKRMLEAFQALMTKRKETHILRSESMVKTASAMPLRNFTPRLRLEPAPTYYLRTARSYRYLERTLRDIVGQPQLTELKGLTQQGHRTGSLETELREMQQLFYGCYVLSAEDIGLKPELMDDEHAEITASKEFAEKWLADFRSDPDLSVDTRVMVPIAVDLRRHTVSTWATLGVRFARLNASYHPDAPPRVRTSEQSEWTSLTPDQLDEEQYLIVVDEFASIQIRGIHVLTRDEFRKICDEAASREEIVKRLQSGG